MRQKDRLADTSPAIDVDRSLYRDFRLCCTRTLPPRPNPNLPRPVLRKRLHFVPSCSSRGISSHSVALCDAFLPRGRDQTLFLIRGRRSSWPQANAGDPCLTTRTLCQSTSQLGRTNQLPASGSSPPPALSTIDKKRCDDCIGQSSLVSKQGSSSSLFLHHTPDGQDACVLLGLPPHTDNWSTCCHFQSVRLSHLPASALGPTLW